MLDKVARLAQGLEDDFNSLNSKRAGTYWSCERRSNDVAVVTVELHSNDNESLGS